MADEENKIEETETVEEVVENAAEDSSSSQAAGEDSSPTSDDAVAEDSEPEEQLSPTERRKKQKASKNRRARYKGKTLEERRAERDVIPGSPPDLHEGCASLEEADRPRRAQRRQ